MQFFCKKWKRLINSVKIFLCTMEIFCQFLGDINATIVHLQLSYCNRYAWVWKGAWSGAKKMLPPHDTQEKLVVSRYPMGQWRFLFSNKHLRIAHDFKLSARFIRIRTNNDFNLKFTCQVHTQNFKHFNNP